MQSEVTSGDPIVRVGDLRGMRWCLKGARAWWEKHNLDWMDFVNNGIRLSRLEQIDDFFVGKLAEKIRGRS